MTHEHNTGTTSKQDPDEHSGSSQHQVQAIIIDPYSDELLEEALESDQGTIHIFGEGEIGTLGNKVPESNIIGILLNMKKNKKDSQPKPPKPAARPVFEDDSEPKGENVREFTKGGKKYSYSNMSFDEFDMKESKIKKTERFQDKIFENTFNTGSTDTQKLPDIKVNNEYAENRLDDCYDSEQYAVKRDLLDKVYEIYMESQWKSLPKDKKFPKELAPFIFNDLWNGLAGNNHAAVDMFVAIAEFMDTSYEKVYEAAGLKVKEQIIKELEGKYKIFMKKKINRLF